MKKRQKIIITLIISIVLVMCISVTAFAYSQTLTGESKTQNIGGRQYTAYNSVTYISGTGVKATTDITCDTHCSAGELGVFPMLQDSNYNIVLRPGWIYNSFDNAVALSAGTAYHSATSGTYYSGGNAEGQNTIVVLNLSPGLSIGSSRAEKIGEYRVNTNGQTYGVVNKFTAEENYPDLVGAVGLDGTEGYILSQELLDRVVPASSEEAAALMTDPNYIQGRIIDLYAADGVTVIGKFMTGGLVGVTVQENNTTTTYNKDGTIVRTYDNGAKSITRWK